MKEGKTNSFKINSDIVFDNIDGEVILLNIEKGTYYQLKNEAVLIWEEIASQNISSVINIARNLSKGGKYSANEIINSITPFIKQLIKEDILQEVKTSSHKADEVVISDLNTKKPHSAFATPILLTYTDMQSILLLDPIHDTDKKGWPSKKKKNS